MKRELQLNLRAFNTQIANELPLISMVQSVVTLYTLNNMLNLIPTPTLTVNPNAHPIMN